MHKKQDRVIAVLAAYRHPLVDPANLDEAFFYNAVWCCNHQLFGELALLAFPCEESGEHIDTHSFVLFLSLFLGRLGVPKC